MVSSDSSPGRPPASAGALVRREGWVVLGISIATIAVELGVYGGGLAAGTSRLGATLACLAATTLWVALTAGVFAAGGGDALTTLLRGGIVADASAVALLVLWRLSPFVTLIAAVKIYCTLLAMALLGVSAAGLWRRPAGRYAGAAVSAVVMFAALATPFWTGGLLAAATGQLRQDVVRWAVLVNPFYCVTAAVAEQAAFTWHHAPILYTLTRMGDYAAPPPPVWYAAAWRFAAAALVLMLTRAAVTAVSNRRGQA